MIAADRPADAIGYFFSGSSIAASSSSLNLTAPSSSASASAAASSSSAAFGGAARCHVAPERFQFAASQYAYDETPDGNSEPQVDTSNKQLPKLTPAMDVFSLGCAIGELLCDGQPLFDLPQLLKLVPLASASASLLASASQQPPPVAECPLPLRKLDARTRSFILAMIDADPSRRPTAQQCATVDSDLTAGVFPAYFAPMYDAHEAMMRRADMVESAEARMQWALQQWPRTAEMVCWSTRSILTSMMFVTFHFCFCFVFVFAIFA